AGGANLVEADFGRRFVGLEGKPTDFAIHRWDAETGRFLSPLGKHAALVEHVVYSPDGRTIAAATGQGLIHLWETATHLQRALINPAGNVTSMAFSNDGRFLAVVDGRRFGWVPAPGQGKENLKWGEHKHWDEIRVWDLATGKEIHRFGKHRDAIASIAFSPDGKLLASGSYDTTVLLWDMTSVAAKARLEVAAPSAKELEFLWTDLVGNDAARAYRAGWTLASAPEQALTLLTEKLQPVGEADAKRMTRLISDLDDANFAVRQTATQALTKLGVTAKPAL